MGQSNPFPLTSNCQLLQFCLIRQLSSAHHLRQNCLLLGAPPHCAGFISPSFFNKLKPIILSGKKCKEGSHSCEWSSTIKQPTLSSYCQNPQVCALCESIRPMDKQSSTQAPIIIFVSIQSFPNRSRDWSHNSK